MLPWPRRRPVWALWGGLVGPQPTELN